MLYLATEMALFLVGAALVGFGTAWLTRRALESRSTSQWEARLTMVTQERDRLAAAADENAALPGDAAESLQAQLEELKEEHRETVERLQARLIELEEEHEATLAELEQEHEAALARRSSAVQEARAAATDAERVLQVRYEKATQDLETERKEKRSLKTRFEAMENRCAESEARVVELEEDVEQLRERAAELVRELETREGELDVNEAATAAPKEALTLDVDALDLAAPAKAAESEALATATDEDLDSVEDLDEDGTWVLEKDAPDPEDAPGPEPKSRTEPESRPEPESPPDPPVEAVLEGDEHAGRQLRALGVKTSKDLLRKCGTDAGVRSVASSTGIELDRLRTWVGYADLMRVVGVGSEHLKALHETGVVSVRSLSKEKAKDLAERMKSRRSTDLQNPATPETVSRWIDQAKALPKITTH